MSPIGMLNSKRRLNTLKRFWLPLLSLHFPDPSVPFILCTHDSLTRIADVLKQQTSSGLKVCFYRSRLLSDTECRYSAVERETLAICWCFDKSRSYTASSSIFIETDHEPLFNMDKKRTFRNKHVDNWPLKIQGTLCRIFEIKYRKGIDDIGPDLLMRYEPLASSFPGSIAATHPSTLLSQHVSLSKISSLVSDCSLRYRSMRSDCFSSRSRPF